MPRKPGKHTAFFELVDVQGQAGCPICRLVRKATFRYLDSILYEAVLDLDVRLKLKRSRGFCTGHVEMLHNMPGRALGIALIYRDVIKDIANIADGERFRGRSGQTLLEKVTGREASRPAIAKKIEANEPCPACAVGRQSERISVEILLAHLDDERLYDAYVQGEGLCLKHFVQALEDVEDETTYDRLVSPQVVRYRKMLVDLDEFIRKKDHRFRLEKSGEEGDVWLRAMNAIVGGAGMGLSAKWGGRRAANLDDSQQLISRK